MDIKTDLIGEMVSEDFRTAAIFKKHGIDFCCRGGRTIEEACENKTTDVNKEYNDLENLHSQIEDSIDFK